MKRLIFLALLVTAALALTACAARREAPEQTPVEEDWLAPDRSVHTALNLPLDERALRFQRDDPDLTIERLRLDDVHALSVALPGQKLQPLLILLHEQGADKEELLEDCVRFARLGWHCVLPDLPGHGESSADTVMNSLECCVRADDVLDLIIAYYRLSPAVDTGHTALLGVSMGGSAAYHYAAFGQYPLAALCCLISGADYTLLHDTGGVLAGKECPSAWSDAEFAAYAAEHNPLARAERLVTVPLFSWNAERDPLVPAASARVLEDRYREYSQAPFRFVFDEGTAHEVTEAGFEQAARFLAELARAWR